VIDPLFLLEEGLRIENLLALAAIIVAVDIALPEEVPMKLSIPANKTEAKALLLRLVDDLDGTPDNLFDAKAFGKRVAGALADDWRENVLVAVGAIVAWEVLQLAWRHL